MNIQGLAMGVSEEGLTPEQRQTLKAIRQRKTEVVSVHRSKKAVTNNQAVLPRVADRDRKSNTTNMRVSSIAGYAFWHHSKLASKGGIFTARTQLAKGTSWSSAQLTNCIQQAGVGAVVESNDLRVCKDRIWCGCWFLPSCHCWNHAQCVINDAGVGAGVLVKSGD